MTWSPATIPVGAEDGTAQSIRAMVYGPFALSPPVSGQRRTFRRTSPVLVGKRMVLYHIPSRLIVAVATDPEELVWLAEELAQDDEWSSPDVFSARKKEAFMRLRAAGQWPVEDLQQRGLPLS